MIARGLGLLGLLFGLLPAAPVSALEWGPEQRLSVAGTDSETGLNHGALAQDSAGRWVAAWAERDGPSLNFRIHSRTRGTAGTWGPTELAVDYLPGYAGVGLGAKFPSLAFLPGDTLLAVWHDYRIAGIQNAELFAKVRAPGAPWGDVSTEIRLTTSQHPETSGDNSLVPSVVVDGSGNAHVAWYDFRYDGNAAEILFKSRTGGAWNVTPGDGPDEIVSGNPGDSLFPSLAVAPDGTLHLAWRDNTTGSYRIHIRSRAPGGSWSGEEILSPAGVAASGVTLAVAPDGTVAAAWSDVRAGGAAIYVRERSPGGGWSQTRRASPAGFGAETPSLAVDALGTRHLAWADTRVSIFNPEVFYQSVPAGGVWDSTGVQDVRLSDGSGTSTRPTLVTGADGTLALLWQDARHGAAEIYVRVARPVVTGLEPVPATVATAWPNPFRSAVRFRGVPGDAVDLQVVDVRGRRVATIALASEPVWDGRTGGGRPAAPGIYWLVGRTREGWRPLGRSVRIR